MTGLTERAARMALSCAMDGGDPSVGELVERLGAQGAWVKTLEGALGDQAARRAAGTSLELVDRMATEVGARFVVPGDEEWPGGLDDLAEAGSIQRGVVDRSGCGSGDQVTWWPGWNVRSPSWAPGRRPPTGRGWQPTSPPTWPISG